jgi:hypothetical protein
MRCPLGALLATVKRKGMVGVASSIVPIAAIVVLAVLRVTKASPSFNVKLTFAARAR